MRWLKRDDHPAGGAKGASAAPMVWMPWVCAIRVNSRSPAISGPDPPRGGAFGSHDELGEDVARRGGAGDEVKCLARPPGGATHVHDGGYEACARAVEDRLAQRLRVHIELRQDLDRDAFALREQAEQNVLDVDARLPSAAA
ncbi:hypothetical protein NGB36_26060 [Streptomyces sp. RB6PN25]|uniref:Uncharacterized protein n=1 Tax=Streptomyces humicola TaxID=2953240 RepID=A0ABT1Q1Z5_9ACTN|nr:hypothetical protein [Streptomyces humicola]